MTRKREVLEASSFGQRVAEEELDELAGYFVKTEHWRRLYSGEVDVVYGSKGTGKSAIYSLLLRNDLDLRTNRGIVVVPAENPRGDPVFRDLVIDPPASEVQFRYLWKIYLLALGIDSALEHPILKDEVSSVLKPLEAAGFKITGSNKRAILKGALAFVRRIEALEGSIGGTDLATGLPTAGLKVVFREPDAGQREQGFVTVDELLEDFNGVLKRFGIEMWIALDRLDVAFDDDHDLEINALRALFRVYMDLKPYGQIRLKIFLRDDIWERIVASGFREASHITRTQTIEWDEKSLLNLVVRRLLKNDAIVKYYGVKPEEVLSTLQRQREFFYRVFPEKVVPREKQSETLDWMLNHTCDGFGWTAPRELIHLLGASRAEQLRRYEIGEAEPEGEALFEGASIKQALEEVSRARYRQTLLAEHAPLKQWLEALDGRKTQQTAATLASIWRVSQERAAEVARELVEIGFFEEIEPKGGAKVEFWVPFLYRDALNMVQGAESI